MKYMTFGVCGTVYELQWITVTILSILWYRKWFSIVMDLKGCQLTCMVDKWHNPSLILNNKVNYELLVNKEKNI